MDDTGLKLIWGAIGFVLGVPIGIISGYWIRIARVRYLLRTNSKVILREDNAFSFFKSLAIFLLIFIFCGMLVSEMINPEYHISTLFYPVIGVVIGTLFGDKTSSKRILKGIKDAKEYWDKKGKNA